MAGLKLIHVSKKSIVMMFLSVKEIPEAEYREVVK